MAVVRAPRGDRTVKRVLEPEVMDVPDQAIAYANADFSDSNAAYVHDLIARYGDDLEHAVDLGCGPGDVVIRVARSQPLARLTAVDASPAMLSIANEAIGRAGLTQRIQLVQGRIPGLPIPPRSFTAILTKDMLHHMHDPQALWQEVQRLGRSGAAVYIMDLMRPATLDLAAEIVERVAPREDPLLKTDFFNSLCAAFTISEVHDQLKSAGLALDVEQVSERHMRICGRLANVAVVK
jgi:ubiquinone/menaquinone biosynthesis C-methylase UbiE